MAACLFFAGFHTTVSGVWAREGALFDLSACVWDPRGRRGGLDLLGGETAPTAPKWACEHPTARQTLVKGFSNPLFPSAFFFLAQVNISPIHLPTLSHIPHSKKAHIPLVCKQVCLLRAMQNAKKKRAKYENICIQIKKARGQKERRQNLQVACFPSSGDITQTLAAKNHTPPGPRQPLPIRLQSTGQATPERTQTLCARVVRRASLVQDVLLVAIATEGSMLAASKKQTTNRLD